MLIAEFDFIFPWLSRITYILRIDIFAYQKIRKVTEILFY